MGYISGHMISSAIHLIRLERHIRMQKGYLERGNDGTIKRRAGDTCYESEDIATERNITEQSQTGGRPIFEDNWAKRG